MVTLYTEHIRSRNLEAIFKLYTEHCTLQEPGDTVYVAQDKPNTAPCIFHNTSHTVNTAVLDCQIQTVYCITSFQKKTKYYALHTARNTPYTADFILKAIHRTFHTPRHTLHTDH